MGCISKSEHDRAEAACKKNFMNFAACAKSTVRVCPEGSPPVTIEPGKISVTVLPLADMCGGGAGMALAPYPPNKQSGSELIGEARVARQQQELQKQGALILKLKSRAAASMKPKIGWGFWLGLGLVSTGIAITVVRR